MDLATARSWLQAVPADPPGQLARSRTALADRRLQGAARALLHQVEAASLLELADAEAARHAARTAVAVAVRSADTRLEATGRLLLARALAFGGALRRAWRELERAGAIVADEDRTSLELQRLLVLYKLGRFADAAEACDRALRHLDRADPVARGRVLNNRGVLQLYLGDHRQAGEDFERAEQLYRSGGALVLAADARHNLGMALARRGRLPAALRAFEEATAELATLGVATDLYVLDEADVLVAARLVDEVRRTLTPTVANLDRAGMRTEAAEGRLYLAQAAAIAADPAAPELADEAERALRADRRAGWAAMARLVGLVARAQRGDDPAGLHRPAAAVAAALGRHGLPIAAGEAWLLAGRVAAEAGRRPAARAALARAAGTRHRGPAVARAQGWEAEARRRLLVGDVAGAQRAIEAGLRVLELHRTSIGATELRILASGHGATLARLGLELALRRGRPRAVLRWAERWRAGALQLPAVQPPPDPELDDLLAEQRLLAGRLREGGPGGRGDEGARRLAELETVVARRLRATATATAAAGVPAPAATVGPLDVGALFDELDGRVLVDYVVAGDELLAVVAGRGRCRLVACGPFAPVRRAAHATDLALGRLASAASPVAAEAAASLLGRALPDLRQRLLGPLERLVADRRLVVVPPAELHAAPWGALGGADRPVSVAPSAALWLRAVRRRPGPGGVALVAGPGLAGAAEEVRRIGALRPGARVLAGGAATVAAAASAVDGADLAHLAAHAELRRDNPLFSSVRLADGALNAHDLERLARPPRLLVISACESGRATIGAGDELSGLAAALLRAGAATVVASVIPLPDRAAVELFVGFHRALLAGAGPAEALAVAAAGRAARADGPAEVAAAHALVCLGAG